MYASGIVLPVRAEAKEFIFCRYILFDGPA